MHVLNVAEQILGLPSRQVSSESRGRTFESVIRWRQTGGPSNGGGLARVVLPRRMLRLVSIITPSSLMLSSSPSASNTARATMAPACSKVFARGASGSALQEADAQSSLYRAFLDYCSHVMQLRRCLRMLNVIGRRCIVINDTVFRALSLEASSGC